MRRIILTTLLAVVSSKGMAEWVPFHGDENIYVHVDPTSIRKTGNRVKMWILYDFKTARAVEGGKPFLSSMEQSEYDCKEEQTRNIYMSIHSGHKGTGGLVFSNSEPQNWEPVPPGSLTEGLWKMACKKP